MNAAIPINALLRIPIEQLRPGRNARGEVGDVTELALSIKTLGMQKPLLVIDAGDAFQVIDGHRRLAAARRLEHTHVDAVVRRDPGERLLQLQLAMSAQSKTFDPIAEAKALHHLMFEQKLTREQIAAAVGKSPGWVRDRIALLRLKGDEQAAVATGQLSVAEATVRIRSRAGALDSPRPTPAPPQSSPRARRSPVQPTPLPHCSTCRCEGTA